MALLSKEEWIALARLYAAGMSGAEYDGHRYAGAGAWSTLRALRDHEPPLAREVVRLDPHNQTTHYVAVITDAGVRFYEQQRRMYNTFYPP